MTSTKSTFHRRRIHRGSTSPEGIIKSNKFYVLSEFRLAYTSPRRLPFIYNYQHTVSVRSVRTYPDRLEIFILRKPVATASWLHLKAAQQRKTVMYLDKLLDAEDAKIN